jgi:Spy/CpxP family protein refolding chaperone
MTPIRISLLVLIFALALSAQFGPGHRSPRIAGEEPGPRGPRLSQLADFLELDQTQLESIAAVQQSYREAVRDNMQAIAEKRRQASESLASDSPDATLIGQLLVAAKQLEDSVRSREGEFIAQTQAVLTEAQKTKLASLESMIPFQAEIREAQGLGLLAGEDGEAHFHAGGGVPMGPMGPPFGGPGFGRP